MNAREVVLIFKLSFASYATFSFLLPSLYLSQSIPYGPKSHPSPKDTKALRTQVQEARAQSQMSSEYRVMIEV